jgi:RND family efflux transporter MFP subunit
VNFGAEWSAFGWIAADDDLTTNVLATASGTVSNVYASVGQTVTKGAPLFAIQTNAAGTNRSDSQSTAQEVMVSAPAAGVVASFGVAIGQVVKPTKAEAATPLASIADLSSVWIVAEIDESDARSLQPGQAVEVRPTALAGRSFKGRLLTLSPVDPETMRSNVRIVAENTDGSLKLNMLAQFYPQDVNDAGTLAVPESAVLFENGSTRVFVVEARENSPGASGKLTARTIRTGRIRDGMVEVIEGLTLGENVAASDVLFIDRAAKGY